MKKAISGSIILAAILAVALTVPVWAHGRGGPRGFSRPAPPRAAHPRGLLGQLIFPCLASCSDEARSCEDTAMSTALSCVTDTCSTEVEAAQTACETDRSSTECRDAAAALAECAGDCLDALVEDHRDCRVGLRDCRDLCDQ